MTISVGDNLPEAEPLETTNDGIVHMSISGRTKGKTVVIFGLPGAFTKTCTAAHMPSFIRTADQLRANGVDEIICVAVNDPFVMSAWGESTGADKAGITLLSDSDGDFTSKIGMAFDAPDVGFHKRSVRYTMLVRDGKVEILNTEEERGVCNLTAGEALLDQIS